MKRPTRATILARLQNELDAAHSWGKQFKTNELNVGYSSNAFGHMFKAEALIELLEVHDCGSVGGFDGQESGLYSLEARLELLKQKYPSE